MDIEQKATILALRAQGMTYERIQRETGYALGSISKVIQDTENIEAGMMAGMSGNPAVVAKREELGELFLDVVFAGAKQLKRLIDDPEVTVKNLQTIAIATGIAADKVQDFMWGRRGEENVNDRRESFASMTLEQVQEVVAALQRGLAVPGEVREVGEFRELGDGNGESSEMEAKRNGSEAGGDEGGDGGGAG